MLQLRQQIHQQRMQQMPLWLRPAVPSESLMACYRTKLLSEFCVWLFQVQLVMSAEVSLQRQLVPVLSRVVG
jgi:hypothetical protein